MTTKVRGLRPGRAAIVLAAGALAAAGGCEATEDEGPAGFSDRDVQCSALSPGAFVREGGRVVSRALAAAERRAARGEGAPASRLGVEAGGRFSDGLRLVVPQSPGADVAVLPLGGASGARARLRGDGALVAYDDAYEGVGVALGATDRRVEGRVRLAGPTDLPRLRYRLAGGPAFGRWHDEGGALFAYDREGRGLFALAPPALEDAEGRVVAGRWRVEGEGAERVVEAEWPAGAVAFPALVSLSFETPLWFPAGGPTPPAPRAGAGLAFYEGGQNCALLFGGFDGAAGPHRRNDVAARCEGAWQLGPGGNGIALGTNAPSPREYAAMAYAPFGGALGGAYVFGGFDGVARTGDFWRLTLSGAPGGPRSATWEAVALPSPPAPGDRPLPRSEAGLAWTGSELLLFGGFDGGNTLFTDTWAFNGTSWRRVCEGDGCFPRRRAFVATTRGSGASREVLAVGGFEPFSGSSGAASDVLRFTGAGWQRAEGFEPAPDATLADGRLSPQGQSAPGPRESPWAAGDPAGNLLLGSGIFDFALPPGEDWNDVWRLEPKVGGARWARVPVGADVPGRRIAGSAVYDPARGETLVAGGISVFARAPGQPLVLNPSPPVAYRSQASGVAMAVTCHDPGGDGACDSYDLEASVVLENDASPSRARLVFLRQQGTSWASAGPGCGSPDAPLAPVAGNVFRCTAVASIADAAFAAQAFDGAPPATDDAQCAPGGSAAPIDDGVDAYAGTSVCRTLPATEGETLRCELAGLAPRARGRPRRNRRGSPPQTGRRPAKRGPAPAPGDARAGAIAPPTPIYR